MRSSSNRNAQSIWLIVFVAITGVAARLSVVLANTLILWRVYGRDRVAREHLQIMRDKPDLVISNGEVLRGFGFQHYLLAAGSWLVLSCLAMLIVYRALLPQGVRYILKNSHDNTPSRIGAVCALGLFLLVPVLLPFAAAVALAVVSLILALSWAWRIRAER